MSKPVDVGVPPGELEVGDPAMAGILLGDVQQFLERKSDPVVDGVRSVFVVSWGESRRLASPNP